MPLHQLLKKLIRLINTSMTACVAVVLLSSSSLPPPSPADQVRAYTREIEFDYVGWTLDALAVKFNQLSLGTESYLSASARQRMMLDYLDVVTRIQQGEYMLNTIYADPTIADPQAASQALRKEMDELLTRKERMASIAEAILQNQIASVVSDVGLTLGGQPIPPVLYHSTALPLALIVSPRNVIRQDADISLLPDLPLEQHIALEEQVDKNLDVSSLVVNIGGVGIYPTMVYLTSNLDALSEIVAHEWIHNYLTLRPLGISYMKNPALRIMNETTASIAGKEIGRLVLERYYPELIPAPAPQAASAPKEVVEAPVFDYYNEMRTTRVEADRLLAEGKVEEAETYMEARRVVFWENGYRGLRKINQAYFAFYGAYADHPGGGAAGEDPVGAAVRALRARSGSLSDFLQKISWMSSFEALQRAVQEK